MAIDADGIDWPAAARKFSAIQSAMLHGERTELHGDAAGAAERAAFGLPPLRGE